MYVRGTIRLSPVEQRERLLDTRFVLTQPAGSVPLKTTGPIGEATLQEAVYQPLIAALAAKNHAPKTLRQIAAAVPEITYPALCQAIAVLVGMGSTAPCQPENAERQVRSRCRDLNNYLCGRAQFGNEIETLASPVTGGGVSVGRFQQLFLSAIQQGKKQPSEWAAAVWNVLAAQGQRLVKEGKTLETAEENLTELTKQATEFSEKHLPILKALQIA